MSHEHDNVPSIDAPPAHHGSCPRSARSICGAVVIGRNEGDRLRRCIAALGDVGSVVYVDSGSTDGSAAWAREAGVAVIDLDLSSPFTAARARNAGFQRLQKLAPHLAYVQFIDGDCELMQGWMSEGCRFLDLHPDVASISGRLIERFPQRSIYNWLCQREWDGPSGEVRYCGGISMMRSAALRAVGGFRDDVIAGEEPELCVRLRKAGWRIWRLEAEMATHDAAITRLSQWWRRALRGGYAFALGADIHGAPPERHFVWESRRALIWGFWLPLACLAVSFAAWPWGLASFAIYPLQALRQTLRNAGSLRERATLAFFYLLARFPEAMGQIRYLRDRALRRKARLIEYK